MDGLVWLGTGLLGWAPPKLVHLSQVTKSYDEFLSHNWQVAGWKKVLLLMTLKRGAPACVIGTSAALVMLVLFPFGETSQLGVLLLDQSLHFRISFFGDPARKSSWTGLASTNLTRT